MHHCSNFIHTAQQYDVLVLFILKQSFTLLSVQKMNVTFHWTLKSG